MPPPAVAVAVPLWAFTAVSSVLLTVKVSAVGCVTVAVPTAVQLAASVIVTVYIPAGRLSSAAAVEPVFQAKL